MKKKIVSLIGALVLICAMSLNVFAAGSPTAEDVKNAAGGVEVPDLTSSGSLATQIISGENAKFKILEPADALPLAKKVADLKNRADVADVTIMVMVDVTADTDTLTVKMSVESTETAYALHLKADGQVEEIPGVVSGDAVVFKFSNGYSPVAIVKVTQKTNDPAPQPSNNNNNNNNTTPAAKTTVNGTVVPTAPKTGDVAMMVIVMAVIFLVGAVVAMSRRRA